MRLWKLPAQISLGLAFVLATGCSVAPMGADQNASTVKDLSEFDPENFNAGNTWEYLVNPSFTWTGEADGEEVDGEIESWLSDLDAFALENEENNFVTMQAYMDDEEINEHNDALSELFKRPEAVEHGYTKAQAKRLYKALVSQEQVWNHAKYDPEFSIGFCFGRAMIVHGFAKNTVYKEGGETYDLGSVPVRKIWVAGPMGQWKHHVATMVLAKEADAGFWVIDNYVGRVTTAAEWMQHLRNDYPNTNVLFNVTRANRFSEANSLRYFQVLLDDPFFNDFFRDFLKKNVTELYSEGLDVTAPAPIGGGVVPFDGGLESVAPSTATAPVALGGETNAPRQH